MTSAGFDPNSLNRSLWLIKALPRHKHPDNYTNNNQDNTRSIVIFFLHAMFYLFPFFF